jgi:hypothetical protein
MTGIELSRQRRRMALRIRQTVALRVAARTPATVGDTDSPSPLTVRADHEPQFMIGADGDVDP